MLTLPRRAGRTPRSAIHQRDHDGIPLPGFGDFPALINLDNSDTLRGFHRAVRAASPGDAAWRQVSDSLWHAAQVIGRQVAVVRARRHE